MPPVVRRAFDASAALDPSEQGLDAPFLKWLIVDQVVTNYPPGREQYPVGRDFRRPFPSYISVPIFTKLATHLDAAMLLPLRERDV